MFVPINKKIEKLAGKYPEKIGELENIFSKRTNVYIDFANVIRWQSKLKWHFDLLKLIDLLKSFRSIFRKNFYSGTLEGNSDSEKFISNLKDIGYNVHTKPVKIMRLPINASSISEDSVDILKQFIRTPFLQKLNTESIKFLNRQIVDMNKKGIFYLEDRKCNFDVEIGRDMLLDYEKNNIDNFVLWSGDSDFADPIKQLLLDGKSVVLFSTSRRIATELNELRGGGLHIFDIQKIKNFICWRREMDK